MTITQELVDRIVERARKSNYGLGAPIKSAPYDLSMYEPPSLDALGLLLINAHYAKYDLVSLVTAALHEVAEAARKEAP